MAYEIEKGVPIPPKASGALEKYPFREMEIGDSFFVGDSANEASFRRQVYAKGQHTGRRYSCRKVDGGLRIWRIE